MGHFSFYHCLLLLLRSLVIPVVSFTELYAPSNIKLSG